MAKTDESRLSDAVIGHHDSFLPQRVNNEDFGQTPLAGKLHEMVSGVRAKLEPKLQEGSREGEYYSKGP